MTHDEMNDALLTYLGGDPRSPGYDPIGGQARLRERYCVHWESVDTEITSLLRFVANYQIDWKNETLASASRIVEQRLATDFPWLQPVVRKKIANYYSYNWR